MGAYDAASMLETIEGGSFDYYYMVLKTLHKRGGCWTFGDTHEVTLISKVDV